MKTIKLMPLLTASLLVILLTSCGPSYVGVGTGPGYGGYGYGSGYYGARPYYSYTRPYGYGYSRPPVIVQRRTYVVPQYRNNNNRGYSPNARSGGGYGGNGGYRGGGGRSRGPR
jgi:uncharacterized membrane protein YgcG